MRYVPREEWGARYGRGHPTLGAKQFLYIHHAAGRAPAPSLEAESARVRMYEIQHARTLTPSNPRIGYTTLFGQSGNVYEGTGPGFVGAHTAGRNSSSWGACFMLDGNVEVPTLAMLKSFQAWRANLLSSGFLTPSYALRGHRDSVATECPGSIVYRLLVGGDLNAPVATGAQAIRPGPTLRAGSGGMAAPADLREAVRELQRRLGMRDRFRTGFFGEVTEDCVRAFQTGAELVVDGIVGPRTWKRLGVWS
jgi:hypothetical protein